jgi:phenylpropionate dioxygenase-like ring-hydroxylating dioxygenase large terminal subunit
MYPFRNDNIFLRNSWYVAAFVDELKDGPVERTIMDEPIALFRMTDGTPAAMWGICPHRYYSLAAGKIIGDALRCNYHGFQFDGRTGACVKIPSHAGSPPGFRQRIYPIVEHGPWLWVWPGDPVLADRSLLPPLAEVGLGDGWRVDHVGLLPVAGRAQLLVENLFDLTHAAYLHGALVDGSSLLAGEVAVTDGDGVFRAMRASKTQWVDGFYDVLFKPENRFDGLHQVTIGSWYYSPGYILTFSGFITEIEGHRSVDPVVYGTCYFHHVLTPKTAHDTHYFSAISRNYRQNDEEFSATMVALNHEVGMQDVAAVGEIEQRLVRYPPKKPELLARADAAAIRVRRRIQADLDAEAARNAKSVAAGKPALE